MGDKSPKSKERNQKQDKVHKGQKKAAAYAKAHPEPVEKPKKGK